MKTKLYENNSKITVNADTAKTQIFVRSLSLPELLSTIPKYIISIAVTTNVSIGSSLRQERPLTILITMTKNRTMSTTARIGVDRIFRTKNKVGSADSKYNVTNIGERTKKSFGYTPNSRLYAARAKKKIRPDFDCNVIANNLDLFTMIPQFICKFTLQQFVSQI